MGVRVQIPRTHVKKPGMVAFAWNLNMKAETGGFLPLLASLTESVSFKPARDSVAKSKVNCVWCHAPLILALWGGSGRWSSVSARSTWSTERLWASLGYKVRPCLKPNKKQYEDGQYDAP